MTVTHGTIARLNLERYFGFIAPVGQPDVFFHKRELRADLEFGEQLIGRRVRFEVIMGPKGPKAIEVWPEED